MSELEFLNTLRVEMVRHRELRPEARRHELFQTSTIEALLGGAFDRDVSLSEILQHGDLGLGTLNRLGGELIVIEGQAWKANRDCTLIRAPGSSRTPYAVGRAVLTGAAGHSARAVAIRRPREGRRASTGGDDTSGRGADRRPLRARARPLGAEAATPIPATG